MKRKYTIIPAVALIFSLGILQATAQKDTTELELGKKKLIIIDKKTQKENAVYNLEKGKETFEKEIVIIEKLIKNHESEIQELEKQIEFALKEAEGYNNTGDLTLEYRIKGFDKTKIDSLNKEIEKQLEGHEGNSHVEIIILGENDEEIEKIVEQKYQKGFNNSELDKLKTELDKHKILIELNTKKKFAFENGIKEIENGIREIENGIVEMDKELQSIDSDTNKVILKEEIKTKRFNAHWAGFEFGLLNFLNSNQIIANDDDVIFMAVVPEKTFSYGLNIFEFNIPITKHSFGVATGAGIQWNSLNLEQNINLVKGEDGVIIAEIIDVTNKEMKKNKLNAAYITVPIVFEYQVPIKQNKLYFGAGIFGGIRAWSKQRQVYIVDGSKYKDKKADDFQLSPFRYGVSARAGYGDIGIFAEYSLVPLFKDGKGPEMYPIMIGIRLVDF